MISSINKELYKGLMMRKILAVNLLEAVQSGDVIRVQNSGKSNVIDINTLGTFGSVLNVAMVFNRNDVISELKDVFLRVPFENALKAISETLIRTNFSNVKHCEIVYYALINLETHQHFAEGDKQELRGCINQLRASQSAIKQLPYAPERKDLIYGINLFNKRLDEYLQTMDVSVGGK